MANVPESLGGWPHSFNGVVTKLDALELAHAFQSELDFLALWDAVWNIIEPGSRADDPLGIGEPALYELWTFTRDRNGRFAADWEKRGLDLLTDPNYEDDYRREKFCKGVRTFLVHLAMLSPNGGVLIAKRGLLQVAIFNRRWPVGEILKESLSQAKRREKGLVLVPSGEDVISGRWPRRRGKS